LFRVQAWLAPFQLSVPSTSSSPSEHLVRAVWLAMLHPGKKALAIIVRFHQPFGASSWRLIHSTDPRQHVGSMTGLPLRLRSAHYHLMEMFPGFAVAALLTQVLAPNNAQLVNLLGLHVILKTLVFYPAYVMGIAVPRSMAHLVATASVINVCWQLAKGAM